MMSLVHTQMNSNTTTQDKTEKISIAINVSQLDAISGADCTPSLAPSQETLAAVSGKDQAALASVVALAE